MTKQLFQRKESDIQKEILHYLQILENRGTIYFIRCNVFQGKIKRANGQDGFIRQAKAGAPDILVCVNGKFVGFEVKTDIGKQSELQSQAESKIKRAGGLYFIVRSVNQAITIINNII